MNLHTIAHLRHAARRRIPRVVFDYVDGGAGTEAGLARNVASFADMLLLPRALAGFEQRSQRRTLFGRRYAAPFAVAPIGMANLIWPGADAGLARAAVAADIPYVISTAGTTPMEDIAAIAPDHAWFQLYVGADQPIVDGLLDRADAAGFSTLLVTVDVPVPGKRVRDMVNGFSLPLKPSLRGVVDMATHPSWLRATLAAGAPRFANLERYATPGAGAMALAAFMARQSSARLDWRLLATIRARWTRRLIVKGVLRPEDAQRLAAMGVDGIVVSNHGGRQLDAAPSSIQMLPHIRAAVGERMAVLLDGGIRTGEDAVKALCAGADFLLLGRAFAYGVGALGPVAGPAATLRIMTDEIDRTLGQIGCESVEALGEDYLWPPTYGQAARSTELGRRSGSPGG